MYSGLTSQHITHSSFINTSLLGKRETAYTSFIHLATAHVRIDIYMLRIKQTKIKRHKKAGGWKQNEQTKKLNKIETQGSTWIAGMNIKDTGDTGLRHVTPQNRQTDIKWQE